MKITEALAEVNLLTKKINEKQTFCKTLLVRKEHQEDPHSSNGGSSEVYRKEVQALHDLRQRLIEIRSKISQANLKTKLKIGDSEKTIFEWLTWKREVYPGKIEFYKEILSGLLQAQNYEKSRPEVYTDKDGNQILAKNIYNVGVGDIQKVVESTEETFMKLDGQLSLLNATIDI